MGSIGHTRLGGIHYKSKEQERATSKTKSTMAYLCGRRKKAPKEAERVAEAHGEQKGNLSVANLGALGGPST